MRRVVILGLLLAVQVSCGGDGAGEPDLYFAMTDAIYLPGGDGQSPAPGADGDSGNPDESSPLEALGEDSRCLPNCANKTCGDDGCDGACGTCPPGYICDGNFICTHDICQPQCGQMQCGDDGCGGSCGNCLPGWGCIDGTCIDDCAPDCFGKDCGPDGCGGSCGPCGGGLECVEGTCICQPDCIAKQCGPDSCGGSCGDCVAPESCSALGLCENLSCQTAGALVCNTSTPGETTGKANNFSSYGCGFDASGPEVLYTFSAATKTFIQVVLEEPGASKHNVYVIMGDCNPNVCVENDFDTVSWTAQPGESYIYSVDGYQGAFGSFTVTVTCIDSGGCPDGKIPGCNNGQCQWGHWLGDGMCTKEFDCAEMNFDGGDCS
jgi:hypothetical protein